MSDFSRPFDQLTLQIKQNYISGIFSILELDPIDEYDRTLYLHAIKYKSNKFELTLAESLIKTGKGLPKNLSLLNPLLPWAWEEVDREDIKINGFLYLGFTWFPLTGWRLFGEVLVDDVNFHNPGAFYLNRFGYLAGVQKTGFPLATSNLWMEYSNILNQVYQSYRPYHIYTHRKYPIGHYLGNDFDSWRLHYSQLMHKSQIRPFLDITYIRDGANGLDTPFDNPWEDENGLLPDYVPPSNPTAPITYVFETEIGAEFTWENKASLSVSGFYSRRTLMGKIDENWSLVIRLWVSIFRHFN